MTASPGARPGSFRQLVTAVTVTAVMAACNNSQATVARPAPRRSPVATTPAPSADQSVGPTPLMDAGLDLRAGPVVMPLELRIPTVRISAPVLAVGITPKNVMDTPEGSANDPVWQKVFWYRGSAIPGEQSTVTIAGHVDDVLGRPAVFARLKDLRPGDAIVIHDLRNGLDVRYTVVESATYTLKQTLVPAILSQIYGSGPVAGQGPQLSKDGLSHLTLITCTGHWLSGSGTYDHRLAVYAVSSPPYQSPRSSRLASAIRFSSRW